MSVFLDVMLRGATVGILLLLIVIYARRGPGVSSERLGTLFFISVAAYAIISLPAAAPILAPVRIAFVIPALFGSVFFWWFALAILRDDSKFEYWRWIPFAMVAVLAYARYGFSDLLDEYMHNILHQIVGSIVIAHVLWLCVAERQDDLIESRRRLRTIIVISVGLFGAVIIVSELIIGPAMVPPKIVHLQSLGLFLFTIVFAAWALRPSNLFERVKASTETKPDLHSLDRAHYDRLISAMNEGTYLQPELTIRKLADQLNVPEHRLRRLINGELGYKNFSSFLNNRRIADATMILADPGMADRQITLIALDLGYGSIGPFNRAFKAVTGMTPSEYRQAKLDKT